MFFASDIWNMVWTGLSHTQMFFKLNIPSLDSNLNKFKASQLTGWSRAKLIFYEVGEVWNRLIEFVLKKFVNNFIKFNLKKELNLTQNDCFAKILKTGKMAIVLLGLSLFRLF